MEERSAKSGEMVSGPDDNPDSNRNLSITFWCIYNVPWKFACKFIPWYLHWVDKL